MTFLEKIAQVRSQINDKNTPERNRELCHQLVVLNAYASYKGMESSEYDEKAQEKLPEAVAVLDAVETAENDGAAHLNNCKNRQKPSEEVRTPEPLRLRLHRRPDLLWRGGKKARVLNQSDPCIQQQKQPRHHCKRQ